MACLKRIYFWLALIALTLFLLVLAIPYAVVSLLIGLLGGDSAACIRFAIWLYGRAFSFLVHPVAPVRIKNASLVKDNAPCIVVANHQSFLDLYFLGAQAAPNICFVVAAWPFKKLFFFALFMHMAKYIRVGGGEDSLTFVETAKQRMCEGASLLCFPEGTRSRTGKLQNFHTGIFRVAAETGAKVVPLIYHNTGAICPPGSFKVNPQPIYIQLLEPMQAEPSLGGRSGAKELLERVRSVMAKELSTPYK